MEELNLSIKPELEQPNKQGLRSAAYKVQVGGWVLDKGVEKIILEMDASRKPKLTIEAEIDYMDIDVIRGLDLELVDTSGRQNQVLTSNQLAELSELRSLKRSTSNYKMLKNQLRQKEKQNSVLSITLFGLIVIVVIFLLCFYR